ncbi:type IV toxin-antitoxin system AbiEi family antitoxin domain-containing protein [Herbiconiux sp. KACC 21604]|uniref:type IV toxin-antitoxin system AbiEi family antitoxin domain-containing protein n=1 Tax=unclassified Herbiconiux TaxID=2618217 RepID=UPI0014923200|nr:type IV toxin-antitoxin system AbiEi family antitoxin domain-containing protein [Herbiconiux sp. SALV-R1]QJU54495.1 DUF559 domain-containing protein [Herbiconiux sp. SALV-R1]WPO85574.1 type IV toxin-antitoxin system AbiEi family antitoxin domain-containing protein [Herbiconiux sp. KACC 21604]
MSSLIPLPEVARTSTLLTLGVDDQQLRRLRRTGVLVRIRHGYYARADARPDIVRAVRLGGRLTSYSALRALGVWCPPGDERLHVAVNAHAHDLRDPDSGGPLTARDDLVVHWRAAPAPRRGAVAAVVPVAEAIDHLPPALDPAHLVAVLDAAVREHVLSRAQLAEAFPIRSRVGRASARVDPASESGAESVARIRLADAGIETRSQVWFGSHRVDLLVPDRVVVEVDGREFHDDRARFERDRRRAAELTRLGLHVLHFSYRQVMYDWPRCLAAVRVAVAAAA